MKCSRCTLTCFPRLQAKDGLFPPCATRIHPKYQTPYVTTIITGVVCAICAGLLPIDILGELSSIGTLFAFLLVSLGVMVLRLRRPELERKFKVPGGPYLVPLLGAGSSGLLICTATPATIYRLFIWMFIGLLIYFFYGKANARRLRAERREREAAAGAL
jgi:basic amino acid/polyamine antiporter, APA family